MRPEQIVESARVCPLLEGDPQCAPQSANETQKRSCVGSENGLHYQLSILIQHRSRDACLMDVETDKLGVIHEGVPFVSSLGASDHRRLLRKGALL
jgi:hypothetical protein